MVGASGMAAAWTRPLTAPAPISAAVPRNPLREYIFSLRSMAAAGRLGGRGRSLRTVPAPTARSAAVDGGLQFGLREPEVAFGLDGRAQRRDPLPRFRQQGEDVDLHAREAKLHLVGDDLAQWQHLALVVARDVVGRPVDPVRVARLGADVDRLFRQPIEGLVVGLGRLPYADLAAVEDRNLELDVEAAFAERWRIRIARLAVDAGDVQHGDEAARFGE